MFILKSYCSAPKHNPDLNLHKRYYGIGCSIPVEYCILEYIMGFYFSLPITDTMNPSTFGSYFLKLNSLKSLTQYRSLDQTKTHIRGVIKHFHRRSSFDTFLNGNEANFLCCFQ